MGISKSIENRVRALARRHGYIVEKSRKGESIDNLGHFMLVESSTNAIVFGSRYDASIDDIEKYLKDEN